VTLTNPRYPEHGGDFGTVAAGSSLASGCRPAPAFTNFAVLGEPTPAGRGTLQTSTSYRNVGGLSSAHKK